MATNPEQDQWLKDTQRWSYHLAQRPDWANTPELEAFAKNIYNDANADPNAAIQQTEQRYRDARTAQGLKTDATSANVWGNDPQFREFVKTGAIQPQPQAGAPAAQSQQAQTVAQQWNQAQPTAQQATNTSRNDALWSQLMQRSSQGLDVSNDPNVMRQTEIYRAEEERARRDYLADEAEAQGPLANLRTEQRMASERMGQRVGGFAAQIAAREISFRREEIAAALESMRGMLSTGEEMELRRQLAELDARLRQYGYDADNSYRNAQLAEQRRQFDTEFDLREWDLLNEDDLRRRGIY